MCFSDFFAGQGANRRGKKFFGRGAGGGRRKFALPGARSPDLRRCRGDGTDAPGCHSTSSPNQRPGERRDGTRTSPAGGSRLDVVPRRRRGCGAPATMARATKDRAVGASGAGTDDGRAAQGRAGGRNQRGAGARGAVRPLQRCRRRKAEAEAMGGRADGEAEAEMAQTVRMGALGAAGNGGRAARGGGARACSRDGSHGRDGVEGDAGATGGAETTGGAGASGQRGARRGRRQAARVHEHRRLRAWGEARAAAGRRRFKMPLPSSHPAAACRSPPTAARRPLSSCNVQNADPEDLRSAK